MYKPVLTYLLITYLFTWCVTITAWYVYRAGGISLDTLNLVYNFGALGPFAGALISARVFYGKTGVKKLLSTFTFKTITPRSLFVSLSPLILLVVAFLVYPLQAGHWYNFDDTREQFGLNTIASYWSWILPFVTYSIFEEFGWRGFLLPHLQEKQTAFKASFVLTIFWATWHLPFFLWRFQFSPFITAGFFVSIFIGAVILTSAFNLSKGSIVSTILFHFSNNVTSALDKNYMVAVVSTGFVLLAFYLVKKYGTVHLSGTPRIKNIYMASVPA